MRKSYWLLGALIGSFIFTAIPTLVIIHIPFTLLVWVGEIIGDSVAWLIGAILGGGIGWGISKI